MWMIILECFMYGALIFILYLIVRPVIRFIIRGFIFLVNRKRKYAAKMELRTSMYDHGIVVKNVIHLEVYQYDMERFFSDNSEHIEKEWACKVILFFGSDCPTKNVHNRFRSFIVTKNLLPSEKQLEKNPIFQENWDIAYNWAVKYEQTKLENLLIVKEEQNKNLEQEVKAMKIQIKRYEEKLKEITVAKETIRNSSLIAKDYEIAQLKEEIEKQKLKFNQLRRKYSYRFFRKNQEELKFENY